MENKKAALSLFLNKNLHKCLIMGMTSEYFFVRENFIKLKEKVQNNKYLQEKYQRIIIALTPPIFMAGEFNYKNLMLI